MKNCGKLILEDGKLNEEDKENHLDKCSYLIRILSITKKSINFLSSPKVDVFKKCIYSNGFIVTFIRR